MPRPYFRHNTSELEEIFKKCGGDVEILQSLLSELKHRKRPTAKRLMSKVTAMLARNGGMNANENQQHVQNEQLPLFRETKEGESAQQVESSTKSKKSKSHSNHPNKTNHSAKPARFTRIEPMGVQGRPDKWTFTLKSDVQLNIDETTPKVNAYSEVLGEYIKELKREGAAVQRFTLEDGVRLDVDQAGTLYRFPFSGEVDIFEGATVAIEYSGKRSVGEVVSILPGKLILRSDMDYGQNIPSCIVTVDNTALLELLKKRLDEVSGGQIQDFNRELADNVFENKSTIVTDDHNDSSGEEFNGDQLSAIQNGLKYSVSYIWGPPGTGKTKTLTSLIRRLYTQGKRILICSNTNLAVDQVLLKLCKGWESEQYDGPIYSGHILRMGQIHNDELSNKYEQYVSVEGVVERRSSELVQQKKILESRLHTLDSDLAPLKSLLIAFESLDKKSDRMSTLNTEIKELEQTVSFQKKTKKELHGLIDRLSQELDGVRSAGVIRRVFSRSESAVVTDLENSSQQLEKCDSAIISTRQQLDGYGNECSRLQSEITELRGNLKEIDRQRTQTLVSNKLNERRRVFSELQEITKKIEEIEKTVLADTRILGATITRTFVSYNDIQLFDVVIVDEASMALLPSIYFAIGRSKERCVICGDFRQLPPIVSSKQQVIQEWIGKDIFEQAGVVKQVENEQVPGNLVMLKEQYRMDGSICSLISESYYRGKLNTSEGRKSRSEHVLNDKLAKPLVIVDTSKLWPFCNRDIFGSRYNIMNSLLVRNISKYLESNGFIDDDNKLGVCTPYSAQARLLRSMIKPLEVNENIAASTVHHFQGDEKGVIVLDIPDSIGQWAAGVFLQATDLDDAGAKLFNVAVSRAKEQLVIVANLTYLDGKLPGMAHLRGILHDMQSRGVVIDASEILSIYPIDTDLKNYIQSMKVDWEAAHTGLYTNSEFGEGCMNDFQNAKKHIVIYSGFITPQRAASYHEIFRKKIAEGVKIRCVTKPPDRNGSIQEKDGIAALKALESIGVVVDLRGQIHEKIVFIDDDIVWFGSLNPLSYTSKTDEVMARVVGRDIVGQMGALLSAGRTDPAQMKSGKIVEKEFPDCPRCGAWIVFCRGRYGPYLTCSSSDCDWKGNPNSPVSDDEVMIEAPECPECGNATNLRRSRYGNFFGCTKYPKCKGTVKITR